jgi:hypothetical protein
MNNFISKGKPKKVILESLKFEKYSFFNVTKGVFLEHISFKYIAEY